MKKLITLLLSLLIAVGYCYAQETPQATKAEQRKEARKLENAQPWKVQYIVGANVAGEIPLSGGKGSGGAKLSANPGLSFEVRLTRHSGLELGVNYRRASYDANEMLEIPHSVEKYISIPLLYKFSSRIINFAVGFNYDIMLADSYGGVHQDERHGVGVVVKVTKDIKIYKGLLIEPYILANPMLTKPNTWLGFGVGVKYRF